MRFGLDRPLLESAENKWGTTGVATTVSGYVYRYDELGRRTAVVRTAWAFAALDRAYTYDPIGNRTESIEGTAAAVEYCANNLNQYQALDADAGCTGLRLPARDQRVCEKSLRARLCLCDEVYGSTPKND